MVRKKWTKKKRLRRYVRNVEIEALRDSAVAVIQQILKCSCLADAQFVVSAFLLETANGERL